MKRLIAILVLPFLGFVGLAFAGQMLKQSDGTTTEQQGVGAAAKVYKDSLDACEDEDAGVCIVQYPSAYEDIAASQTDQVLGGTGAIGDFLTRLVCVFSADPSAGVSVKDGSGSAFTIIPDPGAAGFANTGDLHWTSTGGAWKVTTGTNTTCRASGRFS